MQTIAIIGGTGLTEFEELEVIQRHNQISTDLGAPSSDIIEGMLNGTKLLFLARHGHPHAVAPHKINYRANLLALQQLGAEKIIAVNAVGGIHSNAIAGHISVPHQIIDYTQGRENTYFDGVFKDLDHIDFSHPYDEELRQQLIQILAKQNLEHNYSDFGIYGATQGPRLESIAEINRLEKDGCDLVGMTGMPEAALARELNIPYASLCLVVNPAAGKSSDLITMDDIRLVVSSGMSEIKTILRAFCEHTD
ncbi:MAG: S-methyl-5'-thioinosine phosphorylase [Oleispira sp.]|nr:S-methyl-5'-thioinosine phosphorylase [Oleispira sp.]MBL4882843.1 S-methyl-5'-thioinosine phosphorylase [Oleispira sp.]